MLRLMFGGFMKSVFLLVLAVAVPGFAAKAVPDSADYTEFYVSAAKVTKKLKVTSTHGDRVVHLSTDLKNKDLAEACELEVKPGITKDFIAPTEVPKLEVTAVQGEINSLTDMTMTFKENAYFTKMSCFFFKNIKLGEIKKILGDNIQLDVVPGETKFENGGYTTKPKSSNSTQTAQTQRKAQ
jgi:hypothetical protein